MAEDFTAYNNSDAAKKIEADKKAQEEPKSSYVFKGEVVTRKKSLGDKIADTFDLEDIKAVKKHLFNDIIVPATKKFLFDMIKDGASSFLKMNGSSSDSRKDTSSFNEDFTKYGRDDRRSHSSESFAPSWDNIIIKRRVDAEDLLSELKRYIRNDGYVEVGRLYDLLRYTPEHSDWRIGWYSLDSASIVETKDGRYYMQFPRPVRF